MNAGSSQPVSLGSAGGVQAPSVAAVGPQGVVFDATLDISFEGGDGSVSCGRHGVASRLARRKQAGVRGTDAVGLSGAAQAGTAPRQQAAFRTYLADHRPPPRGLPQVARLPGGELERSSSLLRLRRQRDAIALGR